MRQSFLAAAATLVLASGMSASLQAQQLTTVAEPGSSILTTTCTGGCEAIGETFSALNSDLTTFGFYAAGAWAGPFSFYTQIFAWNGTTTVGNPLFTSGNFSSTTVTGAGWIDFATGGTALTTGSEYLAVLVPVNVPDGGKYLFGVSTTTDAYPLGLLEVTTYTPAPAIDMAGQSWTNLFGPNADLALEATFTDGSVATTPEPATLPLLATGLVGFAGFAGRRKRNR